MPRWKGERGWSCRGCWALQCSLSAGRLGSMGLAWDVTGCDEAGPGLSPAPVPKNTQAPVPSAQRPPAEVAELAAVDRPTVLQRLGTAVRGALLAAYQQTPSRLGGVAGEFRDGRAGQRGLCPALVFAFALPCPSLSCFAIASQIFSTRV